MEGHGNEKHDLSLLTPSGFSGVDIPPPPHSVALPVARGTTCTKQQAHSRIDFALPADPFMIVNLPTSTLLRILPVKTLLLVLTAALVLTSPVTAGQPSPAQATLIEQGAGHPFACGDYSGGKVAIFSKQGKMEWEYPAPQCNDLWVLPNGNLLFVTGHGVQEVNRQRQVVFSYESKSEIYGCQRLANGNTFIAECNAGRLIEVDPHGSVVKQIRLLPEGQDGGHGFIRNARQLASGHYLVTHYGMGVVREYDADGTQILEIAAPGGPHTAIRLPDGNTLIASGDRENRDPLVFEVDPRGNTVWQVTTRICLASAWPS